MKPILFLVLMTAVVAAVFLFQWRRLERRHPNAELLMEAMARLADDDDRDRKPGRR